MRKIKILTILLSLLVIGSCGDDFFETAPQDKLSDLSFWNTDKDFDHAVIALYPYLEGSGNINLETMSDNAVRNQNWYSENELANGSATDESSIFYDEWKRNYWGIGKANTILKRIAEATEVTEDGKKWVVAQARFFRAYLYFRIAFLFKDAPLIETPQTIEEAKSLTKATQEQLYKFVFDELNAIENDFPETHDDVDKGRITKTAVQALKARYYLYAGKHKEAAVEAFKIIENSTISLHNNYSELFQYEGENVSEHILQHQYVRDAHECGTFGYAPVTIGGGSNISPLKSLIDSYLCTDGLPIAQSPLYVQATYANNRDPRLAATILMHGETFGGEEFNSLRKGEDSPDEIGKGFQTTRSGWNLKKHINLKDKDDGKKSYCDFPIIRLAEVYLIYAEAMTEQDKINVKVYEVLNKIRARAYGVDVADVANYPEITSGKTKIELIPIIRNERRVELAFEGHRFWDIRRWKISESVLNTGIYGINLDGSSFKIQDRHFNKERDYYYAIPRKEIELNPNLKPQNPNY
jgi:hypothetical protein